jgi:hypothetical protein
MKVQRDTVWDVDTHVCQIWRTKKADGALSLMLLRGHSAGIWRQSTNPFKPTMANVPIIVQGVAVDNKYQAANSGYGEYHQSSGPVDVTQLAELRVNPIQKFQDVIWTVLFLAHLAVMIYVIFVGMADYQVDLSSIDGSLVFFFLVITAASIVLSILSMAVMMKFAIPLVKAALVFSVGFSLLLAIYGFMSGNMLLGICGAISLAVGLCYARIVWPRIPFAAANLKTALTAVKDNMGLVVATLFSTYCICLLAVGSIILAHIRD